MSWNGTVRCGHCWESGHNRSSCPDLRKKIEELAKENPGFWEKLQSLEPYKPDRTVLFDDSLPVLQQAKREGIKYLFGIAQPDSKNSPIELEDFPQIEDFNQILPSSLNAKEITNG